MAGDGQFDSVLPQRSVDDGHTVEQRLVRFVCASVDAGVEVQLVFIPTGCDPRQQSGEGDGASRVPSENQRQFIDGPGLYASLLHRGFVVQRRGIR